VLESKDIMKLLTKAIRAALLNNGRASINLSKAKRWQPTIRFRDDRDDGCVETIDHLPVVRLFSPDNGWWWLLTEMDAADEDRVYGISDQGIFAGYKLSHIADRFQLVRDRHFRPIKSISDYAAEVYANEMRIWKEDWAICQRMGSVFYDAIYNYIINDVSDSPEIEEVAETILRAARKEAEVYGDERAYEYTWCNWSGEDDIPTSTHYR
jgi:hypothetical protein